MRPPSHPGTRTPPRPPCRALAAGAPSTPRTATPRDPAAEAQRVLRRVEGGSLAGRRGADGAELRRDGLRRPVRLRDVRDELGDGAGHRVGEALLVVRVRPAGVFRDRAPDDLD